LCYQPKACDSCGECHLCKFFHITPHKQVEDLSASADLAAPVQNIKHALCQLSDNFRKLLQIKCLQRHLARLQTFRESGCKGFRHNSVCGSCRTSCWEAPTAIASLRVGQLNFGGDGGVQVDLCLLLRVIARLTIAN
jgi:hypothetical protein